MSTPVALSLVLGLSAGLAVAAWTTPPHRGAAPPAVVDPVGEAVIRGRVVAPDGAPAAAATVIVHSTPPRITHTDDLGEFVVGNLPDRPFLLDVQAGAQSAGPFTVRADGAPLLLHLRSPQTVLAGRDELAPSRPATRSRRG